MAVAQRGDAGRDVGQPQVVALATDGTMLWLVGSAAAYLLLGIAIFRWCERLAKRDGALGQY